MKDPIVAKLESARKDLLDLGLRNPLLNYRPRGTRGLEVVDERAAEVFRSLLLERKSLSFLPVSEANQLELLAQPDEEDPPDQLPAHYTDLRLQTKETSARLQTRLLAIYYAARTHIEEQGANVLYLALGMLKWFEAESAQESRSAPLILIPVELQRNNARARFTIRWTEEDIGENLSLAAKLKADFAIGLPTWPEAEDLDVDSYHAAVARVVQDQPRWSVDADAIVLGLFSFGKFLMYRDLDIASWPTGDQPSRHPILAALLQDGFPEPSTSLGEDVFIDRFVQPGEVTQVIDADSSQLLALLEVQQGRNLVIEGPPGTGKSQTITNIIAEALRSGKTVLFVAQKEAARDVVKRRLDSVGLGDACLAFKSHKASKKALLEELKHTLELGKPRVAQLTGELELLLAERDRLNAYCDAVNVPIGDSSVASYQATGELLRLREKRGSETLPRLVINDLETWSASDFRRRLALVEELQAQLARLGDLPQHPFWGSRRTLLLPSDQWRLSDLLRRVSSATTILRQAAEVLAARLRLAPPVNRAEAETLCFAARRAMGVPPLQGIQLRAGVWVARQGEIREALRAGTELHALLQKHDNVLLPDAWHQDLAEVRQHLAAYGPKWWRFVSGDYRESRARLAGLCQPDALPNRVEEQLTLVDAILEASRLRRIVEQHEELGAQLFGAQWRGAQSNWSVLDHLLDWIVQLHREVEDGALPAGIIDFLSGNPALEALSPQLAATEAALEMHLDAADEVALALDLDAARRFGAGATLPGRPFSAQEAFYASCTEHIGELQPLVAYNRTAAACRDDGLEGILPALDAWPGAGQALTDALRLAWFERLLDRAYRERPALIGFDSASHEDVVRKFRERDQLVLRYNRLRLAYAHWERLPQGNGGGQLAVLKHEFAKRARHLPIRQLVRRAGNAVQAIKPVFMMSPLAIATFLPPGSVKFDLVIFDEASQVKPVDAFGAILRGHQVVVVGDSNQLPPTSFFDSLIGERDYADEEEEDPTSDVESILNLFESRSSRSQKRTLRWHYRSRHESLIAVSNHEFYDNRLVIFPSPDAGREQAGLAYHHLASTSYDRGRTRTNALEAATVARAIMDHARQRPDLTLGVAAFSVPQRDAIEQQLELLRRQDPSCEPFFASHPHEPFFVKNLESVQGDERDVMLISIGYGRDASGYLSMNFGPLNGRHGRRRLNVLITRARVRCEIFTNLTADDIDLGRLNGQVEGGVTALKAFLKYAQTGQLDVPVETDRDDDSPFEGMVCHDLSALGYAVSRQVGSGGFFIDLAVVDPKQPGRYVLGIECDGATYHSARSARDRDRLRQQVLENLGWRIHRIWSTDWFRDPARELRRTAAAIDAALLYGRTARPESSQQRAADVPIARDNADVVLSPSPALPGYVSAQPSIQLNGRELHTLPARELAAWIAQVVEVESPVHVDEAIRRIADSAGVARIGHRIHDACESAIAYAIRLATIRRQGDFLWMPKMASPALRDRSALPARSRKLKLVAPEEVALAVEKVVSDSYGIARDQIAGAVCRLLGFGHMSDDMRHQVDDVVVDLIARQRLVEQQGIVTIRRS